MKKIGFIGLGRMGMGMTKRLLKKNFKVVGYNRSPDKTKSFAKFGGIPSFSLEEFTSKLEPKKRIIWLMLPGGKPTDEMIKKLLPLLSKNDIIINGANDFYKNAKKHSKWCKKYNVDFFDCGISGGIYGFENGYPITAGGSKNKFKKIEPFVRALAPKKGYGYFGKAGSGHYVKAVHNIIEYVYLQGIAEGFELLNKYEHKLDIKKAVEIWDQNSVIDSWLIELATDALEKKDFDKIKPKISSVTMKELVKTKKSVKGYAPAFDASIKIRKDKSKKFLLGKRIISAIRREFGGHKTKKN